MIAGLKAGVVIPAYNQAASLRRLYAVLHSHGAVARASLGEGRLRRALVTPWSVAALALALLLGWAGSRREQVELTLGVLWSLALLVAVAVVFKAPPVRVHLPAWLLAAPPAALARVALGSLTGLVALRLGVLLPGVALRT